MTREDIIAKLKEGFVSIEFDKVDGTRRVMLATLQEESLPPVRPESDNADAVKTRPTPTTSLAVFDMDAADWRSFRWDRLRYVDGVDLPNGVQ
jgi:hypothetical protein